MNQAANELENGMQNAGPLLVKSNSGERQVVHSRYAASVAAAARVAERYAQLPSYSSMGSSAISDQRANHADWRSRTLHPANRASEIPTRTGKRNSKSSSLAAVKPLAWLSEAEEIKAVHKSTGHKRSNQSVSFDSAQEVGPQMDTALIDASGKGIESTNLSTKSLANSLPVPLFFPIADTGAEFRKTRAGTKNQPSEMQLNIFEVDPGVMNLDAANFDSTNRQHAAILDSPPPDSPILDPTWIEPAHLDATEFVFPMHETAAPMQTNSSVNWIEREMEIRSALIATEEPEVDGIARNAFTRSAPWSRRAMAGLIDLALTLLSFAAITFAAAGFAPAALAPHPSIKLGMVAFFTVAFAYQSLFSLLLRNTPGTRFADLRVTGFEASKPTEGQMRLRLLLLPLSVLPAGLGLLWALFDSERLCLHDRLSRTFLRCQY